MNSDTTLRVRYVKGTHTYLPTYIHVVCRCRCLLYDNLGILSLNLQKLLWACPLPRTYKRGWVVDRLRDRKFRLYGKQVPRVNSSRWESLSCLPCSFRHLCIVIVPACLGTRQHILGWQVLKTRIRYRNHFNYTSIISICGYSSTSKVPRLSAAWVINVHLRARWITGKL